MVLARAARSFGQVVLEVRIAAPDFEHAVERGGGQRRATKVRMDDHTGRVENTAKCRSARRSELRLEARREVSRVDPRPDLLACPREHGPGGRYCERISVRARELVHRREIPQFHA